MPIGLGYFPVSFTFGFLTVAGGLPWWIGVFISLTNLTSAGQFAGLNLFRPAPVMLKAAMTTFIINLRYMLMSLSLSQSIEPAVPVWQRLIFSFGITDETFVIASMEKKPVKAAFMFGLVEFCLLSGGMSVRFLTPVFQGHCPKHFKMPWALQSMPCLLQSLFRRQENQDAF